MRYRTRYIILIIVLTVFLLCACVHKLTNMTASPPAITPQPEQSPDSPVPTTPPSDSADLIDLDSIKTKADVYIQDFAGYKDRCHTKEIYYDVSTEGGSLTGYYMGGALKYIEVRIFGEMGNVTYDIYMVSESLIYFIKTITEYDMPMYYENFSVLRETICEIILVDHDVLEYTGAFSPVDEKTADDYKALLEDIEQSLKEPLGKDEIIRMFQENYIVFKSIVDYAEKTKGNLCVYYYKKTHEIIVSPDKHTEHIDEEILNDIEFLFDDLRTCKKRSVLNHTFCKTGAVYCTEQ